MERYLKVVQPMNTFVMIAESMHASLADKMLASFVEYETNILWPSLNLSLGAFDAWSLKRLNLETGIAGEKGQVNQIIQGLKQKTSLIQKPVTDGSQKGSQNDISSATKHNESMHSQPSKMASIVDSDNE